MIWCGRTQVSEFSLIMAKLANQYKVFDDNLFMIITLATLITLLLSSIGHDLADTIWNKFGWLLAFIDRRATFKEEEKDHFHLHDHVVLLGFNEAALEIAEYYRTEHSKDVMVMNLDAALHSTLKEAYTNAKIVKKQKAGPVLDPKTGEPMEPVVIPEDAPGGLGDGPNPLLPPPPTHTHPFDTNRTRTPLLPSTKRTQTNFPPPRASWQASAPTSTRCMRTRRTPSRGSTTSCTTRAWWLRVTSARPARTSNPR
jgi:hypothetical protein